MRNDLVKYLLSKNLEEHTSTIIGIVERHYNKKSIKPTPIATKLVMKRKSKENLYESQFFTIEKGFHTKDKIDIWVLKLKRKIWLGKDNFSELKEFIECYDGYYSGYSSGFIFESMPAENVIKETLELVESLVI